MGIRKHKKSDPQAMTEERRQTLERQYLVDSLKKMREEGEGWITLDGRRLKIEPVPKDWNYFEGSPHQALVKYKSRIRKACVYYCDGLRFEFDSGSMVRAQLKSVVALITENHPREKD